MWPMSIPNISLSRVRFLMQNLLENYGLRSPPQWYAKEKLHIDGVINSLVKNDGSGGGLLTEMNMTGLFVNKHGHVGNVKNTLNIKDSLLRPPDANHVG